MGLIEAAEKMGFIAKGIKGPPQALASAPTPSIAHLKLKNHLLHFVVLIRVGKRKVKYMDPAGGTIKKVKHSTVRGMWTGVLVVMVPGPAFTKKKDDPPLVKRFINLVRPFRQTLMQSLAGAILYSTLGLSTAIFVQKIVDFVLVNRNINLLNLMGTIMVGLLIFRMGISWFKSLFLLKAGVQVDAGLLLGYYRHLLSLPQRFFDTMRTGEILSRMHDAIKIRVFIHHSLIEAVVAILTILITLLAMSFISLHLCILVGCAIPVFIALYLVFDRINRSVLRKLMEESAGLESELVESIQSQKTIRAYGWHGWASDKTSGKLTNVLRTGYKAGIVSILSAHFAEFLSSLLTILMLWTGTVKALNGMLSPGELMSFYALLGYLLGPLRNLGNLNRTFRDAIIAADRLFNILDLEVEKNRGRGILVNHIDRKIEFCNVRFRYGSRPELFTGLSFAIPARKFTGIVGRSGSGKSSIAAMLTADYLPTGGNLLVNDCDIRQINRPSLRGKISIVPQKIEIFSGTILENIAPGEENPDTGKISGIAIKTGLNGLFKQLPGGIYTEVGERGFNLSGGERQRIALARALYHEPEVLILDEATSSLDPVSESEILETINELRGNAMTLVLITHKLNLVRNADQVVLIGEGKALQTGRHEDLIRSEGAYRDLWNSRQKK
jgi:ATP-binding cassette subfamily B protein